MIYDYHYDLSNYDHQEWLSNLMIITTENEELGNADMINIIERFVSAKARKLSL